MYGIDLDTSIQYLNASLRFFDIGEHHISRYCNDDILLLVFEGVLRFSEDGKQYEVSAGEFFIQQHGLYQGGERPSDAPKYLYIHFITDAWQDYGHVLPKTGIFDYTLLKSDIEMMDFLSHSNAPYIVKAKQFFDILTTLYTEVEETSTVSEIADYIQNNCHGQVTLSDLCKQFNFSKNHIINTFKKAYGMTPIVYLQQQRLQKAEYLMEVTSSPLESISAICGFNNYSHFYKLFVRKNKVSPERWRKQKRMTV